MTRNARFCGRAALHGVTHVLAHRVGHSHSGSEPDRTRGKSKMSRRIFIEAMLKVWTLRFLKL